MSFAIYLIGFVLFVAGVVWALSVMGVSNTYIGIVAVILIGLGIFTGVTRTRAKDPSV